MARHWRTAILWAVSLIVTATLTAAAQKTPPPDFLMTEAPTIVSGPDLGFRIERTQNNIAIGKLVVRVDGRWIETGAAPSLVPAVK